MRSDKVIPEISYLDFLKLLEAEGLAGLTRYKSFAILEDEECKAILIIPPERDRDSYTNIKNRAEYLGMDSNAIAVDAKNPEIQPMEAAEKPKEAVPVPFLPKPKHKGGRPRKKK